jgi:hypothetical protein
MSEKKFQELGGGLVKKKERRVVGLFIDGVNLDRATRRINKKVDLQALVRGVSSGSVPVVARYYTVIPHEDDSRQRAFLDAVARAGLSVIVKRLPPKGIARQVTTDLEMAADIVAFSLGLSSFSKENEYLPAEIQAVKNMAIGGAHKAQHADAIDASAITPAQRPSGPLLQIDADVKDARRSVVVVCPSRELSYPLSMAKDLGADTTTADFGQFTGSDVLKSAQKWIDLSGSETIWREA